MDELNRNQNQMNTVPSASVPPAAPEAPQKSRFWKFAGWFIAIIVVAGIVVWVVDYLSPEARSARETQRNYELYQQSINEMEAALRADTYGGVTPQETLDLFIAALRSGNVELASRYFTLEDGASDPKWLGILQEAKTEGGLEEIVNDVSRAVPTEGQEIDGRTFWFSILTADGEVVRLIEMTFNSYSKVWKIRSL